MPAAGANLGGRGSRFQEGFLFFFIENEEASRKPRLARVFSQHRKAERVEGRRHELGCTLFADSALDPLSEFCRSLVRKGDCQNRRRVESSLDEVCDAQGEDGGLTGSWPATIRAGPPE